MREGTAVASSSSSAAGSSRRAEAKNRQRDEPTAEPQHGGSSSSGRVRRSHVISSSSAAPRNQTTTRRRARMVSNVRATEAAASAAHEPNPVQTRTRKRTSASAASSKASNETSPSSNSEAKGKRAKSTKVTAALDIPNCGICFEESFKYAGVLNCCKHGYCHDCITKWASENSNTCPQCKQRIEQIFKTEVATGKRIGRAKKIKHRDISSGYGLTGGVMVAGATNFLQDLLYQLHFNTFEIDGDDEDDEDYFDDDDYDIYDDDDVVCMCCGGGFSDRYFDECPNCGWSPYDIDDEDSHDGESDDFSRRGTRENPIELD